MHQRVSQPRCRHSPRASLQYPVHGPCVAVLAAPGFHRADSQRAAPFACRLCQTLGVTRNPSVKRMHRAFALKLSRPVVQCLSASSEPQARAIHALRSRPAPPALSAVAAVSGKSLKQATRGFRTHRGTAFQAQLASALTRRRGQMLVSRWALPLSEGRRARPSTVSSGSGVGGVQTVPRFSTVGVSSPGESHP